jgi:hypothetical protein
MSLGEIIGYVVSLIYALALLTPSAVVYLSSCDISTGFPESLFRRVCKVTIAGGLLPTI